MNEEVMIKHYEKTQKETLIKILVASRKEVEKLQNRNKERKQEIERLNKIIKHVEDICESSIVSVNQILQDEKETIILNGRCINRNEYQIVRLKAYRTKSKEILERIKELKGENNE